MDILFFSQYYPPEVGAAPTRTVHFARAMASAGHQVTVITGLPNHPSGLIKPGYETGISEQKDGVKICRTWLHASPHKTPLSRLWNYLSFAVSSLVAALRLDHPDLILVSVPPPFVGLAAWLAAVRYRVPLIVDVRDDWPRAPLALGEMRPGLLSLLLKLQISFVYQRAMRIITVTKGMGRSLSSQGVEEGRQVLITNGADTEVFCPNNCRKLPAETGLEQPFTVLYAGTHGLIHGMDIILEAAEKLQNSEISKSIGGIRFLLIGDGVAKPSLVESARSRGLDHMEFLPSQPPDVLARKLREADICIATTRDHPFSGETIPVKIFDYLAAGKPVVGAISGDAAEVLNDSGGGIVVSPGNSDEMVEAISTLAVDDERRVTMAKAGATYADRYYSRRVLGQKMVSIAEEVIRLHRGRKIKPVPYGLYGVLKRTFDITVSLAGLLLLSPLMLVLAVIIRLDSPGPALFRQRRPCRGSREFMMLKFRTMSTGVPDLASHLVGPGSSYVTRIGKILRRSSLDELPQLINVLLGQMSLVGPRPALYNQYDLIAMRQELGIDALRPGVTGWAQIHGRDDIPLDLKVSLDHHYLRNISLRLDMWILMKTFTSLFSSRGTF